MRSLVSALAVTVLLIGCILGQVAPHPTLRPIKASTRLLLTAVAEPASAQPGQTITLKLRLKNVTSKTITVGDDGYYADYELVVDDRLGKEAPKTDYGIRLIDAGLLHAKGRDIQPGEEVPAELEITRIYDLKLPGVYYARAIFRAMSAETPEERNAFGEHAFSNPVEITILP